MDSLATCATFSKELSMERNDNKQESNETTDTKKNWIEIEDLEVTDANVVGGRRKNVSDSDVYKRFTKKKILPPLQNLWFGR